MLWLLCVVFARFRMDRAGGRTQPAAPEMNFRFVHRRRAPTAPRTATRLAWTAAARAQRAPRARTLACPLRAGQSTRILSPRAVGWTTSVATCEMAIAPDRAGKRHVSGSTFRADSTLRQRTVANARAFRCDWCQEALKCRYSGRNCPWHVDRQVCVVCCGCYVLCLPGSGWIGRVDERSRQHRK